MTRFHMQRNVISHICLIFLLGSGVASFASFKAPDTIKLAYLNTKIDHNIETIKKLKTTVATVVVNQK